MPTTSDVTPETGPKALPDVVVVGAGFAGLNVVRGLANEAVNVTVIDQHNFHTFLPLLYFVNILISLWAFVDTITRPRWAFEAAFSSRLSQLVFLPIAALLYLGILPTLWYAFMIRPNVKRYQSAQDTIRYCSQCGRAFAPPYVYCDTSANFINSDIAPELISASIVA